MFNLTENHIKLYQTLRMRGQYGGCNDLEPSEAALLTAAQWQEFAFAYHEWNCDQEIFLERTHYVLSDFMVTGFIEHLLVDAYRLLQWERQNRY